MAVTGILIVIALLLALQIDKVGAAHRESELSTDLDPSSASVAELMDLEREILAQKMALEEVQGTQRETQTELELMEEISNLEEQLLRQSAREPAASSKLLDGLNPPEMMSRAAEIARLQHEIGSREERLKQLTPDAADLIEASANIEKRVKEAEAMVVQKRLEGRKLRLIRQASDTTKEPVIVDVSGEWLRVMRFDQAGSVELDTNSRFVAHLTRYKKEEQYFVFYFRPSGTSRFEELREAVKAAGFELGYDAIAENSALSLGKADEP